MRDKANRLVYKMNELQEYYMYGLMSDIHIDSKAFNSKKFVADANFVATNEGKLLMFGDIMDLILHGDKKRHTEGSDQFDVDDQLNEIVDYTFNTLKPYADNIDFISYGNHECLDSSSELLTDKGWKCVSDISFSDNLATYKIEDDIIEYQLPSKLHKYYYEGKLHYHNSNGINFMITPNHRVVYKVNKANKVDYSENLLPYKNNIKFIQSTKNMNKDYDITYAELELLSWVITDGSITKNKSAYIYQSKEENITTIESLLKKLNIEYTHNIRNRDIKEICGKKLKNKAKPSHEFYLHKHSFEQYYNLLEGKKEIPNWFMDLSTEQFEVVLNTFILADGSRKKDSPTSIMVYKTKEFLDKLQILCIHNGYRASISEYRDNHFRLNITKGYIREVRDAKKYFFEVPYNDYVYCVSVPNSTLIMRRKGKVCITGNSSCIKHNHFDPIKQLAKELQRIRSKKLPEIQRGDYRGFLQMIFEPKYKVTSSGSKVRSSKRDKENAPKLVLYYNHGTGKGAEVTKGMINSNRVSTWINADVMVSGHNHNAWIDETGRMIYVDNKGNLIDNHRTYINMPSYKKSLEIKKDDNYKISFENENFRTAPAHNGCGIMELDVDSVKNTIESKVWLKMNNRER